LPPRIHTIVLHTLGGPFYGRPEMRFVFLTPEQTFVLWSRPSFGAHWIVAPEGRIWPRHPGPGEPAWFEAPADGGLPASHRARLVQQAAPVYAHVHAQNEGSVGIELSHSGRSRDAFPEAQVRSVAWLIRSLLRLSGGRLDEAAVTGHKDLDTRPAYVADACRGERCAYYVDDEGQAYRRRVDPPEGLFAALARAGLAIPRGSSEGDKHLLRAERIAPEALPGVFRP
jgi:hypothetical protein